MEEQVRRYFGKFTQQMLKMGTVKGFKYFNMYMRGKEELIFSVQNEPLELKHTLRHESSEAVDCDTSWSPEMSFNSKHLPYDERSLLLSQRTQKRLSGYAHIDVGLPPASPCESETMETDSNSTLFLLAAYARYRCPYVWVRSNHERIVQYIGDDPDSKDHPLKMKTNKNWLKTDVQPWDMIAEVVKLCTYPAPDNPFHIDMNYFHSLPGENEKLLASGAMIHLLQKVVLHSDCDKYYLPKVFEDLEILHLLHLNSLMTLSRGQSFLQPQRVQDSRYLEQESSGLVNGSEHLRHRFNSSRSVQTSNQNSSSQLVHGSEQSAYGFNKSVQKSSHILEQSSQLVNHTIFPLNGHVQTKCDIVDR